LSSFLLLSPLLEPSLLFFLLSVRSLLGAVAVTPPKKKKKLIPFLACHHSITDFEINAFLNQDSYRLLKFVRFSFNFRHGCFCFTSQLPSASHQAVGHPCNPCNPLKSSGYPFSLQSPRYMSLVHDFLSQQNNRLFFFLDLFVAGWDQLAADQQNNLAEGHPPLL